MPAAVSTTPNNMRRSISRCARARRGRRELLLARSDSKSERRVATEHCRQYTYRSKLGPGSSVAQVHARVIQVDDDSPGNFVVNIKSDRCNSNVTRNDNVCHDEQYDIRISDGMSATSTASGQDKLSLDDGVIQWGIFRRSKREWKIPKIVKVPLKSNIVKSPFKEVVTSTMIKQPDANETFNLMIPQKVTPLTLAFKIGTIEGVIPVGHGIGKPLPLGASIDCITDEVNFAVYSRYAERMSLVLVRNQNPHYSSTSAHINDSIVMEIELDADLNKTGDVWHISLSSLLNDINRGTSQDHRDSILCKLSWGWRARGRITENGSIFDETKLLVDPYVKEICTTTGLGSFWPILRTSLYDKNMDWKRQQIDVLENLPRQSLNDLIVLDASNISLQGVDIDVLEKKCLHAAKSMRANAIILPPLYMIRNGQTINLFAPDPFLLRDGKTDQLELVEIVADFIHQFHCHNLEVYMTLQFDDTYENSVHFRQDSAFKHSFQGLDAQMYFTKKDGHSNLDYKSRIVRSMIFDAMRLWSERHVDGFVIDMSENENHDFIHDLVLESSLSDKRMFTKNTRTGVLGRRFVHQVSFSESKLASLVFPRDLKLCYDENLDPQHLIQQLASCGPRTSCIQLSEEDADSLQSCAASMDINKWQLVKNALVIMMLSDQIPIIEVDNLMSSTGMGTVDDSLSQFILDVFTFKIENKSTIETLFQDSSAILTCNDNDACEFTLPAQSGCMETCIIYNRTAQTKSSCSIENFVSKPDSESQQQISESNISNLSKRGDWNVVLYSSASKPIINDMGNYIVPPHSIAIFQATKC